MQSRSSCTHRRAAIRRPRSFVVPTDKLKKLPLCQVVTLMEAMGSDAEQRPMGYEPLRFSEAIQETSLARATPQRRALLHPRDILSQTVMLIMPWLTSTQQSPVLFWKP